MLVSKATIGSYIPQKPPFVMVDTLVYQNETQSKTQFIPTEDNLLSEAGYFSEAGLIENIAQSAALRAGYEAIQNNLPIKVGFIGAIKNLEVVERPACDSLLETTITVENQIMDALIIKAEVLSSAKTLATCEMRIFLKNPVS